MTNAMRRPLPLLTALALILGGCSDDSAGSARDAGTDAIDAAADTADTAPDVAADAAEESDAPLVRGTIAGNIFNNTGTTGGTLTIALVEALPPTDPIDTIIEDAPAPPQQPYRFEDVPAGTYYVYAMLDVDEPDELGEPGPGDLVGQLMDPVGIATQDETLENINVELF